MRKKKRMLFVFSWVWGLVGAIIFFFYPYFPRSQYSDTKEISITVIGGRTYYVQAFSVGGNMPSAEISTNDVTFLWKESRSSASNDIRIQKASFGIREERHDEAIRTGKAILSLVPLKSGELVIATDKPGDFTLAVSYGYARFVTVILTSGAACVLITWAIVNTLRKRGVAGF